MATTKDAKFVNQIEKNPMPDDQLCDSTGASDVVEGGCIEHSSSFDYPWELQKVVDELWDGESQSVWECLTFNTLVLERYSMYGDAVKAGLVLCFMLILIGVGVRYEHFPSGEIPFDLIFNFLGALAVGVGGMAQFISTIEEDRKAGRVQFISFSTAIGRAAGLFVGIGGLLVAFAATLALVAASSSNSPQ